MIEININGSNKNRINIRNLELIHRPNIDKELMMNKKMTEL